jgi:hypothetical protein
MVVVKNQRELIFSYHFNGLRLLIVFIENELFNEAIHIANY